MLALGLAGAAGAEPAPKLEFTAAEIVFAKSVASSPALAAFYGGRGLKPAFIGPEARPRRATLLAAVETAPQHGLPMARYQPERLHALLDPTQAENGDELEIARIFVLWAHDVSAGILDPREVDSGIKREGQGADIAALLRDFVASDDPATVLAGAVPADPRYHALKAALAKARSFDAPEGTPPAPEGLWRPGARGPEIEALRTRLAAMGFPAAPGAGGPGLYDSGLAEAVRRFQAATGLHADGIAGPATIGRMNAAGGPGPRDLLVAMERLRWLPDDLAEGGRRYIWVNLPQYSAEVFEEGRRIFETRAVIGKTAVNMRTPEFSERMRYIVANPSWNVPRSITVREYLPKLQKNPNAVSHLDVVNGAGNVIPRSQVDFGRYTAANFPYRLREKPSAGNALGVVKFLFPNQWSIYLHDTPTKWLFDQSQRAASHGCVRIGRPLDLARLLLEGQVTDPAATLDAALRGGKERWLTLKPTVPIHLVYFTTLPDENGELRHFRDIYDRDVKVWQALQAAFAGAEASRHIASR